ncbi:MAG: ribonuclease HI [Planctomycetes bacterium]|nr:ribonuclease HI [Planctomycetota bacterium]
MAASTGDSSSTIHIYADGACSGNPGPGGWGAILICPGLGREKELSGAERSTTNNRMEMTAAIEALCALKRPCRVTITTDSRYLVDAFEKGWLEKWRGNGWRTAGKQPVKNEDLWRRLLEAMRPHRVEWKWIRGHAGHPENERADRLAVAARQELAAR